MRMERELRNISLEELAGITRINIRYLKAIEDNDFNVLPAETFVKGFIKSYAKHIGLDEENIMLTYEYYSTLQHGEDGLQSPEDKETMSSSLKLIIIMATLVFVLIFIVLLAYYFNTVSPPDPVDGGGLQYFKPFICREYPDGMVPEAAFMSMVIHSES